MQPWPRKAITEGKIKMDYIAKYHVRYPAFNWFVGSTIKEKDVDFSFGAESDEEALQKAETYQITLAKNIGLEVGAANLEKLLRDIPVPSTMTS